MLKIIDSLVDAADELEYLGVTGLKQSSREVPFLALKCLRREEVRCQTLHDQVVVCHGCVSVFPIFLFLVIA